MARTRNNSLPETRWLMVTQHRIATQYSFGFLAPVKETIEKSQCLCRPLCDKEDIQRFLNHRVDSYFFWLGTASCLSLNTLKELELSEIVCPLLYQEVRTIEAYHRRRRQLLWTNTVAKLLLDHRLLPLAICSQIAGLLTRDWPGPTPEHLMWREGKWKLLHQDWNDV